MSGDSPESFEEYLELEQFLADLQADKAPHLSCQLTPGQERRYRIAILLRAATSGAGQLRQEFAAQLQVQMEEELRTIQHGHQPFSPSLATPTGQKKQHSTRRMLLVSGTAAASVVVGAGSDWLIKRITQNNEAQAIPSPTEWFFVTTVAELGNEAIQFVLDGLIGYVVRNRGTNDDPSERGQILALSAACTHKGCLVQWHSPDRTFRCPCHGGTFMEDGKTDTRVPFWHSLQSLPRLEVKVADGEKIYVRMPMRSNDA